MIRHATPDDAASCLRLYGPIIKDTAISFEYAVPSIEDFAARISKIQAQYPFLVWEESGEVLGYAYATRYRDRAAYDWICESAIYVDGRGQGRGIGKKLYLKLFDCLRAMHMVSVVGGIRSGSPSAEFHRHMGFVPVGNIPLAGYKLGGWHDVEFWQFTLANPVPQIPQDVIPFHLVAQTVNLND